MSQFITMNKFKIMLLWLFIANSVQAKEDKEAYQDCIFQYVTGTEEPSVSLILTNACKKLYIDNFMLEEKDANYNQCLLDNLQSSKNKIASLKVKQACDQKYRSFFN
ncbi:hypothetical protein GNP76_11975 [Aliivibrio fischeri]|nr:hypothetical protein [Aliivibrio fischeri]MUK73846.1 hypothetical protein [Aliivibrio fischeri]